tara:strand:- start:238 stop:492 length:255 start_codon:yes stop_codon:yes gene_type:complete
VSSIGGKLIVTLDGINGINRDYFYKELPFTIRGTRAWDQQEKIRKKLGCYCICLGAIPIHAAAGEKWQFKNKFHIINNRLKRKR